MSKVSDIDLLWFIAISDKPTYSKLKSFMGVTSNQTVADRLKKLEANGSIKIVSGKPFAERPKQWALCSECGQLKDAGFYAPAHIEALSAKHMPTASSNKGEKS